MSHYQLLVIGAGPGGYSAALRAAALGLHTAVVEQREVGGTCLNRGCIPTKALLHASQIYHDAVEGERLGVRATGAAVDLPAMFAYKNAVSEKLRGGIESLLKSGGVDLLRGRALITAPGTVEVTDGEGEKTVYTADSILAATGSVPSRPPVPGLTLPGVVTSDELLAGGERLYRSVVIIGGGVIGVEFAAFYSDLGCHVTVIEGMDRLLPTMDRELGQNLAQILKKQGVEVCTSAPVQCVEKTEDGLRVCFTQKGAQQTVTGEAVLCAIGRRPCWEGLFAPGLAPETDGPRLRVDGQFRTSIPTVYAIGDVSSQAALAHVAAAQGEACVSMMAGHGSDVDLGIVPSCIYSRPEIAVVGLSESEAKERGIPAAVGKCVLFGNARTLIEDPGRCFMKVVAHRDTHEILGAQLMCPHSSDIIGQISQAMANRLTAEQLLKAMRPHPSFEEALTDALRNLVSKLS